MENPNYYAIIPANVRYDKDLTANAKLLYGEITSLCNKEGYCWATNDYFAKLYNVSKTSISKWITQLVQKKYINSKLIYKEGTKEILKRYLSLVNDPIEEKLNRPIEEKLKDNSTSINNKINTKIEYSFFPIGFLDIWVEWLNYKKIIKSNYKTDISEKTALNKLILLSDSDLNLAKKIITQSIENDWKGFFALKENNTKVHNTILKF